MPRVNEKKKNKVGDPYRCQLCSDPIVPGETYYEWSFRYGGTKRQHTKHGHPKQSQLTQSKMSGAYAAIETAEANIDSAECVEDIRTALDDCRSSIDDVKTEYEESISNMPNSLQQGGPAQEMQEKVDELDNFANELEGVSLDDFDEAEPPERSAGTSDEDWAEEATKWMGLLPQDVCMAGNPAVAGRCGEEGCVCGNSSIDDIFEKAKEAWQERHDEHLEAQRDSAREALGNFSL